MFVCRKVIQLTFFICLVRSNKKQTFLFRNLATKIKPCRTDFGAPWPKRGANHSAEQSGFWIMTILRISALGQRRTNVDVRATSVAPLIADVGSAHCDVLPCADSRRTLVIRSLHERLQALSNMRPRYGRLCIVDAPLTKTSSIYLAGKCPS